MKAGVQVGLQCLLVHVMNQKSGVQMADQSVLPFGEPTLSSRKRKPAI